MDEKLKKIIFIVLGAFVVLFLFLFLISSCSSKKYSYVDLESNIVKKAERYYKSHESELPEINTVLSLSLEDLSSKGIIDNVSKMVDKDTNCSGYLSIENNNNHYMYSPQLTCTNQNETYQSENLKETLINNVVTSGNGIYEYNGAYVFRGDKVDNYIMFDGLLWRIVRVNTDGSIRLIEAGRRNPVAWDNRYNTDAKATTGYNNYVTEGINCRIKDHLEDIYNNSDGKNYILSDNAKGYIKETSLCIGKRSMDDESKDGSTECSSRLDNQYIGLIQINEYLLASLDSSCINVTSNACRNYNYLAEFDNSYWTITGDSSSNSQVYKIFNTVTSSYASNTGMAKMVINISENTNVSGKGTESEPYVVSGMSSDIRTVK